MKNLKDIIIERLHLNKDTKVQEFSDEELMNDYQKVGSAYTKNEKKEIADKYGISDIRMRPIQIGILNILRENRKKKKNFTSEDLKNFFRYDVPDTYNKMEVYLKQESNDFIEYLLEYYKEKAKKIHPTYQSLADKRILRLVINFQKYLGHK